ncbi:MAG: L,D-transpeptidase family protein [Eubacteriales bacterium]|nr:L,D-transpeptidase family protein [Eubacteriales bacterium]MDD3882226.1 L,D-transpeptidase family protein [Eubacteriales bacterium]MDD4512575.1 L,D-transpeptidase family protein [Eubacteriales bacterium]
MKQRGIIKALYAVFILAFLIAIKPYGGAKSVSSFANEETVVFVDIDLKRLSVYKNGIAKKICTIATGKYDTPTPIGIFLVNSRFSGEMSGFGTCFLGLSVPWGQYGIHGTNKPESIGYNASHGCIRLKNNDAEEVYKMVPNGSKVVIMGGAYGLLDYGYREMRSGDRGSHVKALQQRLILGGYLSGHPDGVYGNYTALAVRKAQKEFGLYEDGVCGVLLMKRLGLILYE